jgi:Asp-tRNA(Asn)/Glu-tRNA(Gln) amidotransferase A subunit family amidase
MPTSAYDPSARRLTFFDQARRFAEGGDTPRKYLERCLETVAAREPAVQAWVSMNLDGARAAADEAGTRHKAGRPRSGVDGCPIGVKDLIATKDMPTEMGTPAMKGRMTHEDSASVQALRRGGAVIVGKLVTTEMGMSHPGPTMNPWDAARTPGGSSSGSAAAVAADMVPVALGTQVGGSIIRPSSYCGNISLKPTQGALNRGERQGYSQSTLGPHANSIEDMWACAWQIGSDAGGDPGSPGLYGSARPAATRKPRRLVVVESEGWAVADPATRQAFEKICAALKENDVELVTRKSSPNVEAFEQSIAAAGAGTAVVCGWEARWGWRNFAERYPGQMSASLGDRLDRAEGYTPETYRAAVLQREDMRRRHAELMVDADAVIALASPGPAPHSGPPGGNEVRTTGNAACNYFTSAVGMPVITLPLMAVGGLPVGVQLCGPWHGDHALTGLAAWVLGNIKPVVV